MMGISSKSQSALLTASSNDLTAMIPRFRMREVAKIAVGLCGESDDRG